MNGALGMIDGKRQSRVVFRAASHGHCLQNDISWELEHLANAGGTDSAKGAFNTRFGPDWFSHKANVEARGSKFPVRRLDADEYDVNVGTRYALECWW